MQCVGIEGIDVDVHGIMITLKWLFINTEGIGWIQLAQYMVHLAQTAL